jgi:hypothetical protein
MRSYGPVIIVFGSAALSDSTASFVSPVQPSSESILSTESFLSPSTFVSPEQPSSQIAWSAEKFLIASTLVSAVQPWSSSRSSRLGDLNTERSRNASLLMIASRLGLSRSTMAPLCSNASFAGILTEYTPSSHVPFLNDSFQSHRIVLIGSV